MKRSLVFVAITLIFSLIAPDIVTAQTTYNLGIKTGLNLADFFGSDADGMDFKPGFVAGGFVSMNLSERFIFQPGLLYSMKGAKEGDFTTKINYLELPVLFKINYYSSDFYRFHLFFGPSFSYLLSAESELDFEEITVSINQKDYFRSTDFGLIIGDCTDFNIGPGRLLIEISYNHSFSLIDDGWGEFARETLIDAGYDVLLREGFKFNIKNSVISIVMGYEF